MDRRRRLSVTSAERAAAIKDIYQPLHTHVYHLQVLSAPACANIVLNKKSQLLAETHLHSPPPQESYLAPKFKQIVEYCRSSSASREGLLDLLEEEAGELERALVIGQCSSEKDKLTLNTKGRNDAHYTSWS